jgi:hypothetical protein
MTKETSLKGGFRGHVSTWRKYDDHTDMTARATFDLTVNQAEGTTESEALLKLAAQLEMVAAQVRAMARRAAK